MSIPHLERQLLDLLQREIERVLQVCVGEFGFVELFQTTGADAAIAAGTVDAEAAEAPPVLVGIGHFGKVGSALAAQNVVQYIVETLWKMLLHLFPPSSSLLQCCFSHVILQSHLNIAEVFQGLLARVVVTL